MPTSKDLQQLLERIQLRLDESFVGIGSELQPRAKVRVVREWQRGVGV
jgi:hypothetical protein